MKWITMKRFLPVSFGFCILMLLGSQSTFATSYKLNSANSQNENLSYADGDWGEWRHCEEYSGANSAPRSFIAFEFDDYGSSFKNALFYCGEIKSDGTFGSSFTASDNFFSSPGTSGDTTEEKISTPTSKLPVGLDMEFTPDDDAATQISFLVLSAKDIVKGETEATKGEATVGGNPPISSGIYTDGRTIQCNGGYVMTGMRLKYTDAYDEGKFITGVRIKCTKLLEK